MNTRKSKEFIITSWCNVDEKKLHLKTYWTSGNPDAVIFSLHGYGAHVNRPTHDYIAKSFNELNIAYITLDFTGHGYSEGIRGLIPSVDTLINDVLSVLVIYFSNDLETKLINLFPHYITHKIPKDTPFYIMGHSMGGGTAILVADIIINGINSTNKTFIYELYSPLFENVIRVCFSGLLLISPVVMLDVKDWMKPFMDVLGLFPPTAKLPKYIFDESSMNDKIWSNSNFRKYIENDGFPKNIKGLSYGDNIQIGTLMSIVELSEKVQHVISSINYPFIVLYDMNNDIIIPKKGIDLLMKNSKTRNKFLVDIKDGLHDPIANRIDNVVDNLTKWLLNQMLDHNKI
jgi:alpha-beta hydrolase superfamily lysophospholipase